MFMDWNQNSNLMFTDREWWFSLFFSCDTSFPGLVFMVILKMISKIVAINFFGMRTVLTLKSDSLPRSVFFVCFFDWLFTIFFKCGPCQTPDWPRPISDMPKKIIRHTQDAVVRNMDATEASVYSFIFKLISSGRKGVCEQMITRTRRKSAKFLIMDSFSTSSSLVQKCDHSRSRESHELWSNCPDWGLIGKK